ncbi:22064_t:CDS:2 [Entrophospora sp. SA101]|nr:22064_t:CDS:2 [Entrophospora sp. SA101]
MHNAEFVHGDLRCENILCKKKQKIGDNNDQVDIVIIDFDWAASKFESPQSPQSHKEFCENDNMDIDANNEELTSKINPDSDIYDQEHIIKDLNEILSVILSFARTLRHRRFRNYSEQQKQEYWSTINSLYEKFILYTSNFVNTLKSLDEKVLCVEVFT